MPRAKKSPKIKPHHFFALGISTFFLTGAILGVFFLHEMNYRNNFATSLKVFKNGQLASNAYYDVRVDKIALDKGATGSLPLQNSKQYLTVNIYVHNKSSKSLAFFPVDQSYVKDADGKTYNVGLAAVSQPLQTGDIAPGDKVSGQIAYAIPADLKDPKLYLEGLASKPVIFQL